jgi:glycosyltransferase involved in cell wall biosynthesis
MISICIPVYNFNITTLAEELYKQAGKLLVPYEIILIDDASSEEWRKQNEQAGSKFIYIKLDHNIGRSKIRNLFLRYANYDYLLFLDCDSLIISDGFLAKYAALIEKYHFPVICGGRIYSKLFPGPNRKLRWKYGIVRESKPFETRKKNPYKSFMTNNFLIDRKVLQDVQFDERITEYGHEDTLFGFNLKKKGINILHIDNPVLNGDIETNYEYLKKTEKGVANLVYILKYLNYDRDFISDVNILSVYEKVKFNNLAGIFNILFFCLRPALRFLLVRGFVNLRVFDFYKLGFLIHMQKLMRHAGI